MKFQCPIKFSSQFKVGMSSQLLRRSSRVGRWTKIELTVSW